MYLYSYIYIYIERERERDIQLLFRYSFPNKRSYRGPGGVCRGLDSLGGRNLCAGTGLCCHPRSPGGLPGLPSSPVVFRGLLWSRVACF